VREYWKVSMPILLDSPDGKAEKLLGAWPFRVFVIDHDRKIRYSGGLTASNGTIGFDVERLTAWMDANLGPQAESDTIWSSARDGRLAGDWPCPPVATQ
jgi:hypothetical protein